MGHSPLDPDSPNVVGGMEERHPERPLYLAAAFFLVLDLMLIASSQGESWRALLPAVALVLLFLGVRRRREQQREERRRF
jgi:MYXO-CTERM domain-containing protein